MSAIGPFWLPSTLFWTSDPNGAVVACNIISKLLLAFGREPYRTGVHATPIIDPCKCFAYFFLKKKRKNMPNIMVAIVKIQRD